MAHPLEALDLLHDRWLLLPVERVDRIARECRRSFVPARVPLLTAPVAHVLRGVARSASLSDRAMQMARLPVACPTAAWRSA